MFESATFKLTCMYIGFLALVCLFFSVFLYASSSNALEQEFNRQTRALELRIGPNRRGIDEDFREELVKQATQRLEENTQTLKVRLVAINIGILSLGSAGSYVLARRTLRPIEKMHIEQIRFTGDASHELRTPLTSMRTEIDVALRDHKLTKAEAIAQLESTSEELIRMSNLSEHLLKLSRVDESTSPKLQKLSVDALTSAANKACSKTASVKATAMQIKQSDASVHANFDMALEVLTIFIENAIKYSPAKSVVTITPELKGKSVLIHVSDKGSGLSRSEQSHVFERFYRADMSRTDSSGHGLGLSIAQTIESKHPGMKLMVKSDGHGLGSTFTMVLDKA